jgi:hypothetical protein
VKRLLACLAILALVVTVLTGCAGPMWERVPCTTPQVLGQQPDTGSPAGVPVGGTYSQCWRRLR